MEVFRRKKTLKSTNKIFSCFVAFLCCTISTLAQTAQKSLQFRNCSPILKQKLGQSKITGSSIFLAVVKDRQAFDKYIKEKKLKIRILNEYGTEGVVTMEAKWSDVVSYLATTTLVSFIDEKREPREELMVGAFDLSTNKVTALHNRYPFLTGNETTVSIKENKPDTSDIDLLGRFKTTNLSSAVVNAHATIMATMVAGGENSYREAKGVAGGATITSSSFASLLPDPDSAYKNYNISVQNHSYGTAVENYYGADALAYDASTVNNPALLHIFSSGNSGTSSATTGTYAGINNFANITGSFKMAKNIITVGATDSFSIVQSPSSKGPAYDGRVKPELVAFGADGSSGAAAIVSGTALVLQQAYKEKHSGKVPPSALVKALLLNSADDAESKSIDFKSGYGSLNALKAAEGLLNDKFFSGSVSNGGSQTFNINIPAGLRQVKLTMVWNDRPAAANAPKALVNDLDLQLQLPATSQTWDPWILNHTGNVASLSELPVRKRDSLNVVEQVTVDSPAAGNYLIKVAGFSVPGGSQDFYIAYQFDTLRTFNWLYPTKTDYLNAGNRNLLRWENNSSTMPGTLEFSTDGRNWQSIYSAVDISKGSYAWQAPDTFSSVILRMTTGAGIFYTDTVTISELLRTNVGFNCTDSFSFNWNKVQGVNKYQVYRLGAKYLEHFITTSDTAIILEKASNASMFYTVAPLINNSAGIKSNTFNYSLQGVGCYIRTFYATLNNASVGLDLDLGSAYRLKTVVWEKLDKEGFKAIRTLASNQALQYNYLDSAKQGVNTYRIKLELDNGQVIYSNQETVYYAGISNYVIYPNPVRQSNSVNIISTEINGSSIQLFNSVGIKVLEKELDDIVVSISTASLPKGVYFIRITKAEKRVHISKLVIL